MGPSSRSLELKVMSCKGLQAFNFFQKLSVHAVVSLTSDNPSNKHHHLHQQPQKTKTDTEGDKDPEWNQDMRFDLDSFSREDFDHLYLLVDLRYELGVFGDKSLGEVRVPLTDLVGDDEHGENCGVARFVSYEVRNQEKKPNGVLTFSYKVLNPSHAGVGGSATAAAAAAATVTDTTSPKNNYGRIDGYAVVNHVDDDHHDNSDQNHDLASYHHPSTTASNPDHQHHHNSHVQDLASYVLPPSYIRPPDQHLQAPYGHSEQELSYYYSSVESTTHGFRYPSLETPSYPPRPGGEGYLSYPRLDHDQFRYPPPPPPPGFYPPPHPHPPPPPFHPHPELIRISSDPFPPPQPPFHHHHPHHHHAAQGEVYPPPSTRDVHEHSYSMPSSMYYNGDGTRRY